MRIADENQACMRPERRQQSMHHGGIDHRYFIDDDEICVHKMCFLATSIYLEQPMQRLCIELLERCTKCFCMLVVSPCNVLSDFIDERIKASVQRLQHTRRRFPCRSGQRNAWKRSTLLQGSDVFYRQDSAYRPRFSGARAAS